MAENTIQEVSLYVVYPVVVSHMYWKYRCIELPYQLLPPVQRNPNSNSSERRM